MKRKHAILFDMDGVLIDSELAMTEAARLALLEYGIPATREDFFEFSGMGENRFVGGVAEKYGVPFRPEMKDRAYQTYGQEAKKLIVVYPGIADLIRGLRSEGRKLAVASAADWVKVNINLDCIGLSPDDFDAVISGTMVTKNKPDPEIYLKAANAVGADPADCIGCDDTVAGVQSIKYAGMTCVGITSTYPAEDLRKNGADYILQHTLDLRDLLKQIEQK